MAKKRDVIPDDVLVDEIKNVKKEYYCRNRDYVKQKKQEFYIKNPYKTKILHMLSLIQVYLKKNIKNSGAVKEKIGIEYSEYIKKASELAQERSLIYGTDKIVFSFKDLFSHPEGTDMSVIFSPDNMIIQDQLTAKQIIDNNERYKKHIDKRKLRKQVAEFLKQGDREKIHIMMGYIRTRIMRGGNSLKIENELGYTINQYREVLERKAKELGHTTFDYKTQGISFKGCFSYPEGTDLRVILHPENIGLKIKYIGNK